MLLTLCLRTKACVRFHPPYVQEQLQLLEQHRDLLAMAANEAWLSFLAYAIDCKVNILGLISFTFSISLVIWVLLEDYDGLWLVYEWFNFLLDRLVSDI